MSKPNDNQINILVTKGSNGRFNLLFKTQSGTNVYRHLTMQQVTDRIRTTDMEQSSEVKVRFGLGVSQTEFIDLCNEQKC